MNLSFFDAARFLLGQRSAATPTLRDPVDLLIGDN